MASQVSSSHHLASQHPSASDKKDVRDLNRLKMEDIQGKINGRSIGADSSFKGAMNRSQQVAEGRSPWDFSGGTASELQEYSLQKEMQGKNKGAFSQLLKAEDLDKEMEFMVKLIVEDFKNPDPTQERDHTQQTMAMLTMMNAGSQMQVAKNVDTLTKQTEQQTQLILESRIGKKVQYRDRFFELAAQDKHVPIRYRLGQDAAQGILRIHDANGHTIEERTLTDLDKGDHQINWMRTVRGSRNPAKNGIYFVDFELQGHDGKKLTDADYLFELEGVISGIEKDEKGMPIYFVGGEPVTGSLTRVSHGGEFQHFSNSLEEGLDGIRREMHENRPIQPAPPSRLQQINATMEARALRHNPYIDAIA